MPFRYSFKYEEPEPEMSVVNSGDAAETGCAPGRFSSRGVMAKELPVARQAP